MSNLHDFLKSTYDKVETRKKMVLTESLKHSLVLASLSTTNSGELCIGEFYLEKHYVEYPILVLKQDLKEYKKFFRELKKKCMITEFIFGLNLIKNKLEDLNNEILTSPLRDEYFCDYFFDYNEVVVFIERYIAFCKVYISDELYEYSFDMQKELFYIKNDLKERFKIINDNLDTICFNEKYNKKSNGSLFGGIDFGIIYTITQDDAKNFLKSELKKEDYKSLQKDNAQSDYNKIKWHGAQSELIELTKALYENGNLIGKQEDIFIEIQKAFSFKLNNIDQAITKFNGRSQETETKFLNKLKKSLSNYISTKANKNR